MKKIRQVNQPNRSYCHRKVFCEKILDVHDFFKNINFSLDVYVFCITGNCNYIIVNTFNVVLAPQV